MKNKLFGFVRDLRPHPEAPPPIRRYVESEGPLLFFGGYDTDFRFVGAQLLH
jgi:hypothetical protein